MDEVIHLKDQIYVLATSSLADQRSRVLKHGDRFAVFDVFGNIQPHWAGAQGFFDGATRHLSQLDMRMENIRPHLLSSNVRRDNTLLTVDMMNRGRDADPILPGSLHVFRSKFLYDRSCHERVRLTNYGERAAELSLTFRFHADFADIFEIRGTRRQSRGERLPPLVERDFVVLAYRGLDGVERFTQLVFHPAPERLSEAAAEFRLRLPPREQATLYLTVSCEAAEPERSPPYARQFARLVRESKRNRSQDCQIQSSSDPLNEWIYRSQADLHMMVTQTPQGPYPYAGVPLFNTVFGRDGLITALQTLWVNPEVARGVLSYLAATQATEDDPANDSEPGKILHEVRTGEMVGTGEVPFKRYYGSVDSTPLFVVLASQYFEFTGDRPFIDALRPNVEAALAWMDRYGDRDGDGFVEYRRRSPNGLINQGWKDSHDSVFLEEGPLAEGPIALCEIQGYVYDAKLRASALMEMWGEPERAERLVEEAERLRDAFEEAFWCDRIGMYALALDGAKRPCRVASSNAGHALFSGIADSDRARRVATRLLGEKMFSGWGVRTIGIAETRYNPMSYHNGSIWPHDNSLIAEGLSRYGHREGVRRVFQALFDAAIAMDLHRLPELYCGFARRAGEGPTLYPVACSPQGWAAGSVFLALKALLGMSVDGLARRIRFRQPELPEGVQWLTLRNLRVGDSHVDLWLQRHGDDVGINILRSSVPVEVVVVK